jgi:CheY-like chemotaxis protein
MEEPPRILIVDNEPLVLGLFTEILREAGYDVQAVGSGTEGIEAAQQGSFHLLVLDLSMPEPDGFEILKILRSTKPELKILVVSGFMHGALLRAAGLFGAAATMNKTDAPRLLLKTVRNLLAL